MRNIVLGRASTTSPSTSIFSSFWAITSSRVTRPCGARVERHLNTAQHGLRRAGKW
jgi:hypothetical protein